MMSSSCGSCRSPAPVRNMSTYSMRLARLRAARMACPSGLTPDMSHVVGRGSLRATDAVDTIVVPLRGTARFVSYSNAMLFFQPWPPD